jgi:transcriptional regulator with XRE-family HTH domain
MKKNTKLEALRKRTPKQVKLVIDHSLAVADRINEILVRKNLSQRNLAERLGKSESEISKWMRGTHNFTLKTIARLEADLGEPIFAVASKRPTPNAETVHR